MSEIQHRKNSSTGLKAIFIVVGLLVIPELKQLNATAYVISTLMFYSVLQVYVARLAWLDIIRLRDIGGDKRFITAGWCCGLVVLPVTVMAIVFFEDSTTLRTLLMCVSGALLLASILLIVVGGRVDRKRRE
jgi:uncharacterized protein involved in response to NO